MLLAGPPGLGKTSLAQIVADRARRAVRPDRRPGARAQGRHRRLPDRARAARGVLRRRDPPPAARGRGDLLSRDGGPPAADHRRRGRGRARRHARPAAVHADRRDHPRRPADHAAARPLRHPAPPRPLRPRRPRADRHALGARARRRRSTPAGARAIAERARGTPRVANRLLKRVRDYAEVRGTRRDRRGRSPARRSTCWRSTTRAWTGSTARSSRSSATQFGGGPVGLSTLAVAVREEADTIEDVYEPYLLQRGFLQRTPARALRDAARVPRTSGSSRPRPRSSIVLIEPLREPVLRPSTATDDGASVHLPELRSPHHRRGSHSRASATRPRAARSAASASSSSCSTTTTRRPTPRSSSATRRAGSSAAGAARAS